MENRTLQLAPGTALKGEKFAYTIQRVLGEGGFGITYLATMSVWVEGSLGRIETKSAVAIKEFFMKNYCGRDATTGTRVVVPDTMGSAQVEYYRKRFAKEAGNVSKLDHPNIVKVLEVFEANNTAYIAMEYVEGMSLRQWVRERGPLSEREALGYVRQVAMGLAYTHGRHIMHLDLKPANILRRTDGTVKVIDFGLSKQYDAEGVVESASMDPAGISEGYSPFELYDVGSVAEFSPATDIYSLGATLYFMLVGTVPLSAPKLIQRGDIPIPDGISPAVGNAIRRAMKPSKLDRPQDIGEFLALLPGGVPADFPLPPTPSTPSLPSPSRGSTSMSVLMGIVGVVLLLFIVGGLFFIGPKKASPTKKKAKRNPIGTVASPAKDAREKKDAAKRPFIPKGEDSSPAPASQGEVETQIVTGRVYSSADNEPVAQAVVTAKGTSHSILTGSDGRFSLKDVPATVKEVTVTMTGFLTRDAVIEPYLLIGMTPVPPPADPVVPEEGVDSVAGY
ncbi:MAG: protein kinase [Mediterranea sp.]|jgi:serine/threonine protein kinase|nr:protein kinase [Mediterranea sp.]